MPTERREIIFADDELTEAVRSYARAHAGFLPRGLIIAAEVHTSATPVLVTMAVEAPPGEDRETRVSLDREQVTAVLIRACLEINVPLPRIARKSADVLPARPAEQMPARVCLLVTIS